MSSQPQATAEQQLSNMTGSQDKITSTRGDSIEEAKLASSAAALAQPDSTAGQEVGNAVCQNDYGSRSVNVDTNFGQWADDFDSLLHSMDNVINAVVAIPYHYRAWTDSYDDMLDGQQLSDDKDVVIVLQAIARSGMSGDLKLKLIHDQIAKLSPLDQLRLGLLDEGRYVEISAKERDHESTTIKGEFASKGKKWVSAPCGGCSCCMRRGEGLVGVFRSVVAACPDVVAAAVLFFVFAIAVLYYHVVHGSV